MIQYIDPTSHVLRLLLKAFGLYGNVFVGLVGLPCWFVLLVGLDLVVVIFGHTFEA